MKKISGGEKRKHCWRENGSELKAMAWRRRQRGGRRRHNGSGELIELAYENGVKWRYRIRRELVKLSENQISGNKRGNQQNGSSAA